MKGLGLFFNTRSATIAVARYEYPLSPALHNVYSDTLTPQWLHGTRPRSRKPCVLDQPPTPNARYSQVKDRSVCAVIVVSLPSTFTTPVKSVSDIQYVWGIVRDQTEIDNHLDDAKLYRRQHPRVSRIDLGCRFRWCFHNLNDQQTDRLNGRALTSGRVSSRATLLAVVQGFRHR